MGLKAIRQFFLNLSVLNPSVGGKFVIATCVGLVILLTVNALVILGIQRSATEDLLDASRHVVGKMTEGQVAATRESLNFKMKQLAKMLAEIAPGAITSGNSSGLFNYAIVAAQDPDVSYVEFKNVAGKKLADAGDKNSISDKNLIELPIVAQGKELGKVVLAFNEERNIKETNSMKIESKKSFTAMENARGDSLRTAGLGLTTMLVIISLCGGVIVYMIARQITKPLNFVVEAMNDVAEGEGDLTRRIHVTGTDEVAQVARSFNRFADKIHDLVVKIMSAANSIRNASEEIAVGNEDLSQRTSEQASSLEETAATMEEMNATVKQSVNSARQANQLAGKAREQAGIGGEVVTRAVTAMNGISDSSNKISEIISLIDAIAFQTNLLALNAAVEAARAGEQGRGFAVVAAEVRSLAQRSATAAREIKQLISDSVDKVRIGSGLVHESGKTLEQIISSIQSVANIMAEISAASQEQASGIDQVSKSVTLMDHMTQQNAALVEEAAATSRSMQDQATILAKLVSLFKVQGGLDGAPSGRGPAVTPAALGQNKDPGQRRVVLPLRAREPRGQSTQVNSPKLNEM